MRGAYQARQWDLMWTFVEKISLQMLARNLSINHTDDVKFYRAEQNEDKFILKRRTLAAFEFDRVAA